MAPASFHYYCYCYCYCNCWTVAASGPPKNLPYLINHFRSNISIVNRPDTKRFALLAALV